jgi:hypothetical protein
MVQLIRYGSLLAFGVFWFGDHNRRWQRMRGDACKHALRQVH